ncbi:MAG: GvpL/GvpF family gas vesicle protein [Gaiellaceae bacterium]
MMHLYAFAERLGDLPGVDGLDGAPLERLLVEDVHAVFSRRTAETSRDTLRRDALAHGAVVEALTARAAAVAPVRFGELVADDDALAESLRARLPELRRAFDRVRDCVEVAVRVHEPEHRGERPANGTAYMHAAARAPRRDELHDELTSLAREARLARESAAYLVAGSRIVDVGRAVVRLAAAHDDVTVVCTGPWAPFSFVEGAA